jgi:hypothetical protein
MLLLDTPSNCLKENIINAFWFLYARSLLLKRGGEAPLWKKEEQMSNNDI